MGELATSEVKLIIDDLMPYTLSYDKNKNRKQLMLLTQIKHGLTSSFKQKVMSILDGSKKHASRYNYNDRLYYHNIINNVDVRIKLFI